MHNLYMHIARHVCRNLDESEYFPFSFDFEIMRLTCSFSKFKKQCTNTDTQHVGTVLRDTR